VSVNPALTAGEAQRLGRVLRPVQATARLSRTPTSYWGLDMTVRRVMPVFTVSDVDAARDAYMQVFGLREVMNLGWITTLADDDLRHQFSLMTKDATAPVNPMVSIEVDDWGVRRFFFADAAANVVNVLTHQRDL
jgi:hypothetical protein